MLDMPFAFAPNFILGALLALPTALAYGVIQRNRVSSQRVITLNRDGNVPSICVHSSISWYL